MNIDEDFAEFVGARWADHQPETESGARRSSLCTSAAAVDRRVAVSYLG